ncbi:MAG: glycosyltransferase family 2 protein [Eubacterium sp.]
MIGNPLISIIVPVYKTEQFLDRCVESIVNQTYKNLEIILVDDGSPDNCPVICDAWAEKDSRIKVIHKENGGVASARNIGIAVAEGFFISFIDSDDYVERDLISHYISQGNDFDVSVCDFQYNNDCDTLDYSTNHISKAEALKRIAMGDYKFGIMCNKLYRTDIAKRIIVPDLACCEDLVFNYHFFKNDEIKNICESSAKLYHYYVNEDSKTHKEFSIGAFDAVKSKQIIIEFEKDSQLEPFAIKGLLSSCFVVISGIIQNNKFLDEFDELRACIKNHIRTIMMSPVFSKSDKIKSLLITFAPNIYKMLIKRKYK